MKNKWVLFFILSFLCLPSLGWATMVRPLDLKQLTRQAEKIFVGHCEEANQDLDENGLPALKVHFQVSRGIKGVADGDVVVMKQFGDLRLPLSVREGEKAIAPMKSMSLAPRGYEVGDEYLLFIYPESSLGFTSSVGGGQGRFQIETKAPNSSSSQSGQSGLKFATNPLGNQFLNTVSSGPIELNTLVQTIENLVNAQKDK